MRLYVAGGITICLAVFVASHSPSSENAGTGVHSNELQQIQSENEQSAFLFEIPSIEGFRFLRQDTYTCAGTC